MVLRGEVPKKCNTLCSEVPKLRNAPLRRRPSAPQAKILGSEIPEFTFSLEKVRVTRRAKSLRKPEMEVSYSGLRGSEGSESSAHSFTIIR